MTVPSFETNAKDSINVEQAFLTMETEIKKKFKPMRKLSQRFYSRDTRAEATKELPLRPKSPLKELRAPQVLRIYCSKGKQLKFEKKSQIWNQDKSKRKVRVSYYRF